LAAGLVCFHTAPTGVLPSTAAQNTPGMSPSTIQTRTPRGIQLGKVVGASVGYKNFSIAYQYFGNKINGTASNTYNPIWSGTHVLLAKYRANLF